jgi:outer membrane receptor protein involved in Fe transport
LTSFRRNSPIALASSGLGGLVLGSLAALAAAHGASAQTTAPPSDGASVEAVVVTAQRPATQTLLDRKVYGVSKDLQATTGSAADVLNNVPSVAVDADGGITLRGDGSVTVLLDGKPSAQFSGAARGLSLQQFPASDIDHVEVMTTAPAQYKAAGAAGVINIVTKKVRRPGISGGGQVSVGNAGRYVLALDGAYNRGPLKLAGGVGLRRDIRRRVATRDRIAADPTGGEPAASRERVDEQISRLIPLAKFSVDYDLGGGRSVGASFNHREQAGPRNFEQHDERGPAGLASTSISDRHSDGHEWNVSDAKGLTFAQKLSRPGETLDLALQRSSFHERERYAYRNTFALPASAPTFDDLHLSSDLIKTEATLDYHLPLAAERDWRMGYDLEDDRNGFDNVGHTLDAATGEGLVDPNVTNEFRYHQQLNAAYAQYEQRLGAWRLQSGVRFESTHVSFFQITGQIPGGWNGFGAYPTLHLERDLGDNDRLQFGLARRITRPDPQALNPFVDHQDIHNLRAGNPNLQPQDTWTYELDLLRSEQGRSFGATVYYRFDRNAVTEVLQPVDADVVLVTKANLPKSRSAGLEFSANGKLGAAFSYNLSGDVFFSQIDAQQLGAPGLKSTSGVNLKAGLDYHPSPRDIFQVSFSRTGKRLTPQGYFQAINLVNLGYRAQLRPTLALVVTVSDVFDGQRSQRVTSTPVLQQTYARSQSGRISYAGIVYVFGNAKKKDPAFDYDR